MHLLAAKPLAIVGVSVAAVGLTTAGAVLQHQPAAAPQVVTQVVPTVIRLPGTRTVIIVPGPTHTVTVPVPGGTATAPGPSVTVPGGTVTVQASPQPGPTVTVTRTPAPGPGGCVHPPGRKCRHIP